MVKTCPLILDLYSDMVAIYLICSPYGLPAVGMVPVDDGIPYGLLQTKLYVECPLPAHALQRQVRQDTAGYFLYVSIFARDIYLDLFAAIPENL